MRTLETLIAQHESQFGEETLKPFFSFLRFGRCVNKVIAENHSDPSPVLAHTAKRRPPLDDHGVAGACSPKAVKSFVTRTELSATQSRVQGASLCSPAQHDVPG